MSRMGRRTANSGRSGRGVAARWSLATLSLVLSLFAAGCGEYPGVPHPLAAEGGGQAAAAGEAPAATIPGDETPPPAATGSPGSEEAETGSGAGTGETETGAASGEEAGPPSTVEILEKDFELVPDQVTAKAGTVTFVLKNGGRYTHDFRVEGQGVDDKAPKIGAGRTFEWEITLEPGKYEISCPVSNHAKRGMKGTLEVVA